MVYLANDEVKQLDNYYYLDDYIHTPVAQVKVLNMLQKHLLIVSTVMIIKLI